MTLCNPFLSKTTALNSAVVAWRQSVRFTFFYLSGSNPRVGSNLINSINATYCFYQNLSIHVTIFPYEKCQDLNPRPLSLKASELPMEGSPNTKQKVSDYVLICTGANPLKIFTPQDKFTNATLSMKTILQSFFCGQKC